jgi:hypothetical protein
MAHHGTFIDHLTRARFNTNYMVKRGKQSPPIFKILNINQ